MTQGNTLFLPCVALAAMVLSAQAYALPDKQSDKLLGQYSTPDAPKWTQKDVVLMCARRFDNRLSIDKCRERNQRKIGHEKTPGEMQDMELLEPDNKSEH